MYIKWCNVFFQSVLCMFSSTVSRNIIKYVLCDALLAAAAWFFFLLFLYDEEAEKHSTNRKKASKQAKAHEIHLLILIHLSSFFPLFSAYTLLFICFLRSL